MLAVPRGLGVSRVSIEVERRDRAEALAQGPLDSVRIRVAEERNFGRRVRGDSRLGRMEMESAVAAGEFCVSKVGPPSWSCLRA